jgi:hypothetical protein
MHTQKKVTINTPIYLVNLYLSETIFFTVLLLLYGHKWEFQI